VEYGKKVDAFRARYSDYLWKGEFLDTIGAKIQISASVPISYSVFLHSPDKRRAVVLINDDLTTAHEAKVELERASSLRCASPESPELQPCDAQVVVPARSAVVVFG
jgi:hypothetical protein